MISALAQRRRSGETAGRLCAAVSRRARDPVFYRDYGVADSIDGRFDLLALHAWLLLQRLRETGEDRLAQSFVNALFARFEEALREQGAGDIGMSRRMKKMAGAFYGRLEAYSQSSGQDELATAILRNVYRGAPNRVEEAASLAKYIDEARRQITGGRLERGELELRPVPAF
jgi:cytochrome b pre-mRNA-processing protein 3